MPTIFCFPHQVKAHGAQIKSIPKKSSMLTLAIIKYNAKKKSQQDSF